MAHEIPNVGADKSMQEAMATKMQLILDQPMSDITTKLVNNDFEGDLFKIGDTVRIVKPDPASVEVELDELDGGAHPKDKRLDPADLKFTDTTLAIDKYAKYAFIISDITKAEGKWNYESGNLDVAAQKIRKAHNTEVAQLIATDANVVDAEDRLNLGTAAAPLQLDTVDELYEKVLIPMHTILYDRGAITADGQVTYGSNAQEAKATAGAIFMPRRAYNAFLTSKYFAVDRGTTAADDKVATGNIAKVLGLEVNVEPCLDPKAKRHITVAGIADNDTLVIIAGTRNCVTRAGKVLPPENFRSKDFFATEYHGLELYGQKIVTPEAAVVAFVKMPA